MSGVVTATISRKEKKEDKEYKDKMNQEWNLMSIDIIKEVNKIPTAQIILLDGDAAKQEFKISNEEFFKPGNELEIKLRYEGEAENEATVFKGIIVRHCIQADQHGSFLKVDLKDAAFKLTTQRKSKVFRGKTDSEIIKDIIKIYEEEGLELIMQTKTQLKHKEMVQYYCTDWDFIVSRADMNGQWVFLDNGDIYVLEPYLKRSVKHTFKYGISDIYEFEMEADISHQYETIESTAWDIKTKEKLPPKKAKHFSLSQGDLKGNELAKTIGAENYQLISSSQLDEQELQVWADAKMLKSRFSMLKGRLKVPGFADIMPGDTMKIDGIGDRFNGTTLVTAIRHQVDAQGWQTDVQFGLSPDFFAQQNNNIIDTPAAGLIPAIHGLQIGIVDKFEEDPDKQFRVKVRITTIENDSVIWARLASVEAGNKRGIFFRPEPGDEVILGFINDDPRQAIILGAVHSEKNPIPGDFEVNEKNNKKGIVTKEGLKIIFDDENKSIEIRTRESTIFRLSYKDEFISLKDEYKNTIKMNTEGIQIKSLKDIVIKGKNVTINGSKVDVN